MLAIALLAACTLGDAQNATLAGVSRSAAPTERIIRVGQIYMDGADDMGTSAILNELKF